MIGKLLIISHTEHFVNESGEIVGWGSTIREINNLLEIFDEIIHIAPLYETQPPLSALPYFSTSRIKFIPIKPTGGGNILSKFGVIFDSFSTIKIVNRYLKEVDCFQFRAPTGIGVYLVPWLTLFSNKRGWFKYAGNWIQENPPLSYSFQRFFFKYLQSRIVTVNGNWGEKIDKILPFENPCLNEIERSTGKDFLNKKNYCGKLSICFVGHLTKGKGAHWLLDFLKNNSNIQLGDIHIVGDGPFMDEYKMFQSATKLNVYLYGYRGRDEISSIMAQCHFIVLPSKAEGFPKVIAEGANYGCIPIVSDISAISQYVINGVNGFLLNPKRLEEGFLKSDMDLIFKNPNLTEIAFNAYQIAEKFTFKSYNYNIQSKVIASF
jgi:glycosyltransferase involved in cell wall biosynthesis